MTKKNLTLSQALSLAKSQSAKGNVGKARQLYSNILTNFPKNKDAKKGLKALQNKAAHGIQPDLQPQIDHLIMLYSSGRLEDALIEAKRLSQAHPVIPFLHKFLADCYVGLGQLEAAAKSYKRALEIKPDQAEVFNKLGVTLNRLGQVGAAVRHFERALEIESNNAVAHNNLGLAYRKSNRLAAAVSSYKRALEIKPEYALAHNNLGSALAALDQWDEAVASFERAREIKPDYAEAHCNLANAFRRSGQPDAAIACLERALEIRPDFAVAFTILGSSLRDIGRFKEAIASYRKALQIDPYEIGNHSNLIFVMQHDPDMVTTGLKEEGVKWWEAHGKGLPRQENRGELDISKDRPLRIGMVSPNFRLHPVGLLAIQLIENANHSDMQFYCYSERSKTDEYTRRFEKAADHWSDINGLSDLEVFDKIQRDRIDILFDLSGHTKHHRLTVFARKPASIQVAWIEPGTRGLPTIDYILADRFHVPKTHESQYSEKVIRMPQGYVCFDPPTWSLPISPLPARRNGFITFGCFNRPLKINDRILQKWAEILKLLPNSKLVLKYKGMDAAYNKKRVLTLFIRQGIDGSRITFEGQSNRKELIERYNDIDIALDTWPYSGGVITCEALWMGVPVVTTPGQTFAGRHSFSHLRNVGFTDSIADNLDNYVETAVSLATDIETLACIRSGLRKKMEASPLCDGPLFATDFGVVMRQLWTTYIDGVRRE